MHLSTRSKVMAPLALLAATGVVAGTAAFTSGNATVTQAADVESVDYLTLQTATAATPETSKLLDSGVTVTPKYGHLPEFYMVADGGNFAPSSIIEAGDILYVDSASGDSDDAGNVLEGLRIEGNVVNAHTMAANFDSYMVPLRVYNTTDAGVTWTEVTSEVLDVAENSAYWLDAREGGEVDITLRGDAELDEQYVITVEEGGSIVPAGEGANAVAPEWTFAATPLAK